MTGKIHVFIGTASLACLCYKYPGGFEFANTTVYPLVSLVCAAAGSYAPDIDMQRTHAGQKHKVISGALNAAGVRHRGITHTLLVPAILTVIIVLLSTRLSALPTITSLLCSLVFGFLWGWILHIAADLCNGKGCPVLWPVVRSKISLLDIPSTGAGAWIFSIIVVIAMTILTVGVDTVATLIGRFF